MSKKKKKNGGKKQKTEKILLKTAVFNLLTSIITFIIALIELIK